MAGKQCIMTLAETPVEIIDGDRGKNYPKQQEFLESGHCLFLNAGNVTSDGFNFSSCSFISLDRDQYLRKGKLARHDVILTTRGTVGKSAYFDESVPYEQIRINSGMVILRALKSALHPRYLYLVIRSELFLDQVQALRTGSAQPQLPIRDIQKIKIPLPTLPEQHAIAHILGTLDDKIELNRRRNKTLEEMARALFKSWFIDFEPVRAKMAGCDPGLPKHLADLFPDRLVDSELGEIPDGWEVGCLGDIVMQSKEKIGTRTAVVLSTVRKGELVSSREHFTKQVYSKRIDNYLAVQQWDIAYNPSRINIGSVGMLKETVLGAVSPVYVVARPESAYRWFLDFALRLTKTKRWIIALASGSVRQSVSYKDFASIPLAIPPLSTVQQFDRQWNSLRLAIENLSEESKTLTVLRDTLLPKLISGKLRTSNVSMGVIQ